MHIRPTVDLLLIGLPTAAYHLLARYVLSMMVERFAGSDLCVGNWVCADTLPRDDLFDSSSTTDLLYFEMAQSSRRMEQSFRRIVFSGGECVQHYVTQCACHSVLIQVYSVLVPNAPALRMLRPRSQWSCDVIVCAK